jgi:hypothetical protein
MNKTQSGWTSLVLLLLTLACLGVCQCFERTSASHYIVMAAMLVSALGSLRFAVNATNP